MKDTRIDGVDLPSEDRIDGIYEGANAFDTKAIASYDDARQLSTEIALPVLVTRGAPHPRTQKWCVARIKSLKSNSRGVLAL